MKVSHELIVKCLIAERIEQVFVMVIANLDIPEKVNSHLLDVVRCYTTLALLAQYHHHDDSTLADMKKALIGLEHARAVFIREGIRKDFDNLPRHHALRHLVDTIMSVGALSGVSTGLPENLHRHQKAAYKLTNRTDYIPQITQRLQNYEVLDTVSNRIDQAGLPSVERLAREQNDTMELLGDTVRHQKRKRQCRCQETEQIVREGVRGRPAPGCDVGEGCERSVALQEGGELLV
jgi:hypothetical protein